MASIEPVTRAMLFSSMSVGAIDAGHLHVAVGRIARAGWRRRRSLCTVMPSLCGRPRSDCRPNCGCRRRAEPRRRPRRGRSCLRGRRQRPRQRSRLAGRRQGRQFLRAFEHAPPARQRRSARRRKSPLSFSHHFSNLPRAWLKRVVPAASSAMLIEAEVSSRKISAGRSAGAFLIAEAPAGTSNSHDQQNRRRPQAEQRAPLRGGSVPKARW